MRWGILVLGVRLVIPMEAVIGLTLKTSNMGEPVALGQVVAVLVAGVETQGWHLMGAGVGAMVVLEDLALAVVAAVVVEETMVNWAMKNMVTEEQEVKLENSEVMAGVMGEMFKTALRGAAVLV